MPVTGLMPLVMLIVGSVTMVSIVTGMLRLALLPARSLAVTLTVKAFLLSVLAPLLGRARSKALPLLKTA